MRYRVPLALLLLAAPAWTQEGADQSAILSRIAERLDHLEQQNRDLIREVTALRQELAASQNAAQPPTAANGGESKASTEERLAVAEARTAEQAQTKVEASQRFPIQLTGMVLFNAFSNSEARDSPAVYAAGLLPDSYGSGATGRQTLLGFDFQGPEIAGGGRVNGTLSMDFWGGSSQAGLNWLRLRRADVSVDWANRTLTVGQDKPLISPYQPDSLAEVGVPPLAGAGNLWYWMPQIRYEQRVRTGANSGIKAQAAIIETGGNPYSAQGGYYPSAPNPIKPAYEGRVAFWHNFDDTKRFEIAPGFHLDSTHIAGNSVGSRIASLDWLIVPWSHLKISGTAFMGHNVAGLGALGNGIALAPNGAPRAIGSSGGWSQLAFAITSRLTWNVFSGIESDQRTRVASSNIVRDWTYASNLMYHLGPNLVVGLEGLQMRTTAAAGTTGVQNHYDLAVGYLF